MTEIGEILRSWGIINPAEFFFGIGICIGVPLLVVSGAFGILFLRVGTIDGRGWRLDKLGVAGCLACCAGMLAVFIVPIFGPPDRIPTWAQAVMAIGTVVGAAGLATLLAAVFADLRCLFRPRGTGELRWARSLIWYLPLIALFAIMMRLYNFFGVR
jgi:hypothetical protein